jgi:enediyne biosynthesis protein E4
MYAIPLICSLLVGADAASKTNNLWGDKIPGPVSKDANNVPTLTTLLAPKDTANGCAVVVCPGGGYSGRATGHEGTEIAAWLNKRGVHAFILKYRTVGESKIPAPLEPGPMLDVQRAIRTVRAKAKDYGVDPNRIGVWGFSAGGHLASTAATHFDGGKADSNDPIEKASCRPDFAILAYPVITMTEKTHGGSRTNLIGSKPDPKLVEFYSNEKHVTAITPPTFLFHTVEDQAVPIENSRLFKAACEKAGVPVQLVEYEKGQHGVGLGLNSKLPFAGWSVKLEEWMKKRELFEKNTAWFEDVTDILGLNFVHDPGPTGKYALPQALGSGCAFIHDGDGTLYVYLLQNAGPDSKSVNQLFKRMPDGKFKDVTKGSGLGVAGYNMGVAVADVNNDGLPDVLLTQYGGIRLFLNLGKGAFQDVTEEAGLKSNFWGTSAAFLDYDRDGWLDLFVVGYLEYDPKTTRDGPDGKKDFPIHEQFRPQSSKLFRNLGSAPVKGDKPAARVRFQDASARSGIASESGPGLGVVCADFDGDGWPDVFVANNGKRNHLWINQRNGTFKEEAVARGVAFSATGQALAGAGIAIGDIANEGLLDLFVPHLTEEKNTLWKQGPRGMFSERAVAARLTAPRWRGTGFGTLMADFNLDGSLDIAVVNGRVHRGNAANDADLGFWKPYAERNQLFANDGSGKFRDVSPANKAFCGGWNVGRGLACTDFDGDGAPDLLVTTVGGRARLFRNVAPDRGHWLTIRALDPHLKRDAYGAEVFVKEGHRKWLRLINPAQSYLSSSSPFAYFGLGAVTKFDSIQVKWPDGTNEEFPGGNANRYLVLKKGEGRQP